MAVVHPECAPGTRRPRSHEAVVASAEAYLDANPGHPVRVSELSRVVGLSERGLRDAYYTVRGVSPARSMVQARLRGARRTLSEPRGSVTVTDVAVQFGFFELGRFAALYRRAFGEVPSATLRARRHREVTETGSPSARE